MLRMREARKRKEEIRAATERGVPAATTKNKKRKTTKKKQLPTQIMLEESKQRAAEMAAETVKNALKKHVRASFASSLSSAKMFRSI
jgi:hypothetical protein